MKRQFLPLGSALCALSLLLTGCFDDKYNLDDIDTNAEFKVKDLVVPVNLDEITLKSIIDLDENSKIKIINDEYVFVSDGDIASSEISIDAFRMAAPSIPSTQKTLALPGGAGHTGVAQVAIPSAQTEFAYEASGLAEEIKSIDRLGLDFSITMRYEVPQFKHVLKTYKLKNLQIQLPKGIECKVSKGSYDKSTGIVTVPEYMVTNNVAVLTFNVTAINVKESTAQFSAAAHSFRFADKLKHLSGTLEFSLADMVAGATMPAQVVMTNTYEASDVTVHEFSGRVAYQPSNLSPAPFTLGDLPDVLNQSGTNISIDNPQIYVNITNPLYSFGLKADVELALTAKRGAEASSIYALDNKTFALDAATGCYCLSPKASAQSVAGYQGAKHVAFTSLSDVLSGNGLPEQIDIDLDRSRVPEQQVVAMPLGKNLGKISGAYKFYAPLKLKPGSKIVYSDTENGWSCDDLDNITIKHIVVTAKVSSDCPVSATFSAYPIDVNGNRIEGVTVEVAEIGANAQSAPISIVIDGEVKHLDGITFEAVTEAHDGGTLSPKMSIKMDDIKVKVSGNYIKKL